jgi:hypothetical protein
MFEDHNNHNLTTYLQTKKTKPEYFFVQVIISRGGERGGEEVKNKIFEKKNKKMRRFRKNRKKETKTKSSASMTSTTERRTSDDVSHSNGLIITMVTN